MNTTLVSETTSHITTENWDNLKSVPLSLIVSKHSPDVYSNFMSPGDFLPQPSEEMYGLNNLPHQYGYAICHNFREPMNKKNLFTTFHNVSHKLQHVTYITYHKLKNRMVFLTNQSILSLKIQRCSRFWILLLGFSV